MGCLYKCINYCADNDEENSNLQSVHENRVPNEYDQRDQYWLHPTAPSLYHIAISHHYITSLYHITISHHYITSLYHNTISHHYITSLYHITISHHFITLLYHITTSL